MQEVKIILVDRLVATIHAKIKAHEQPLTLDYDAGFKTALGGLKGIIQDTAKTIDVEGLAGEVFNWFVENDIKVQMLRSPEAKILQAGEHVEPAKRLAAAIIDYIGGGKECQ